MDFRQQTDTVHLLLQINRKMVNTIRFRFDLTIFRKDFSVWLSNDQAFRLPRGWCLRASSGTPWKPSITTAVYVTERFKRRGPPMMPRGVSFMDGRWEIFHSGSEIFSCHAQEFFCSKNERQKKKKMNEKKKRKQKRNFHALLSLQIDTFLKSVNYFSVWELLCTQRNIFVIWLKLNQTKCGL